MREFQKAAVDPMGYSFTFDINKIVSNVTDFTPFKNAGKSGFNFSNLGGSETYHLPQDTPENLDTSFLQHHGSYALSLAKHFGNVSLDKVKNSDNAVYFTLARSWMVFYSERWTFPFTILALVLFLVTLWMGLRKRVLSGKGVVSGLLVSFLMFAAASGFGIAVQTLFSRIYFKLDRIQTMNDLVLSKRTIILEGNKWIIGSLILAVLILIGVQWFFRQKANGLQLVFGSMILWVILSGLSAFFYARGPIYFLMAFDPVNGWPAVSVFNKSKNDA